MSKTFLEYVAEDIIKKYGTDLSRIAVVFPNKRAALFLNEHLARIAGRPVWCPTYITISDLFRLHSDVKAGDSIKLICDIHKSFVECTGINETLDHFYGWGQLLLADFDDIDKNMADADKIFCNLKDIHELDDISYLDEEQREMLKKFFANFSADQETELKKRFLSLWSHFSDIYHDYNKRLEKQGIGYEGAIYRKVATASDIQFKYDTYLFVGFNLLQKVEHLLFSRLKKEGKARFYWDFDKYYMPKGNALSSHEAGHYIAMYLADFPNELDNTDEAIYGNMRCEKSMEFISAPTENAQARYASEWLRTDSRYKDRSKTAVVMCDEGILLPLMHSLPTEADKVNITSGFPLGMTPIASLVALLFDMYTLGMRKRGEVYRTLYVAKVLSHPYARFVSCLCTNVLANLKERHIMYPDRKTLVGDNEDEGLSLLFPANKDINKRLEQDAFNIAMLRQIADIIKRIGIKSKDESDALFQESVFRMFTVINRLAGLAESGDLSVDITTLRRLFTQLVSTATIPFHGEPVVGVQVMGVLETRNLDFSHVLLLSCNEGNMPKGVNDSSFIPYSIRKAHGLTTIDNKVAIYSYYFHRLLQRADDITIMYNNTTDNGHTGEMSRFMLQLLVEGGQKIKHSNLVAKNVPTTLMPKTIAKDDSVLKKLDSFSNWSPSAINTYIRCKLAFFYQYIAHIKEPDAEADTVDNRMFGNIFHKSAFLIYKDITERYDTVEKLHIQTYLKDSALLASVVDKAFEEELFKSGNNGRRPDYNGLQIINREVIIEYLRQLLRIDSRLAPFKILGMEEDAKVHMDLVFNVGNDKEKKVSIGGIIDRLDIIDDKETGRKRIRIVDYKTGHQSMKKIMDVDEIFDGMNIRQKHSNYYLQAFLYSLIVEGSTKWNPNHTDVSPALLFIKQAASDDYDPTLTIGESKVKDVGIYREKYMEKLKEIMADIFSPNTSFSPTEDRSRCEMCAYRKICGL